MKERSEDMIGRFEQMPSEWLEKKRNACADLHNLATEHQDAESAANFRQRVQCADIVLATRPKNRH